MEHCISKPSCRSVKKYVWFKGTDSVFKRAFSILIPPLVLSVHEREPFLSEEQLYSVAEQILEYVYLE